jgi:hypothetical protein
MLPESRSGHGSGGCGVNPLPLNQASKPILPKGTVVVNNKNQLKKNFRPFPFAQSLNRPLRLKNNGKYATFSPMKNKILIAILLVLLTQTAQAGEIKAMLGPSWNKYLFSSEISSLTRQQKTGIGIGLGYAFEINPKMRLEANVLYNEKGAITELEYAPGKTTSGTYSNHSFAFPFFFQYRLKDGPTPYAALGPEINFILAHKLTIPEYKESFDISDNTSKFIVAFNIALGYELPLGRWGLFAEARFNRWLSNLWKSPDASVKSESVSIVLGGIYYL